MKNMKQLKDLNVSLLEVLCHAYTYLEDYCKKHDIPMPNDDRFYRLLSEASHLINIINEIALPTNQKSTTKYNTNDDQQSPHSK